MFNLCLTHSWLYEKILLFRLLQLGSEWTPGDRQRNIFNVPRWGLMSTVQTHHRATSSAYHQWTAGTKWWRRTWNGQSLDWRAGSYTKTHIYWWSMTNRNSWQLLKCSTVCHSPYCTMLLFIARNATMFYLSLCLSVCMLVCFSVDRIAQKLLIRDFTQWSVIIHRPNNLIFNDLDPRSKSVEIKRSKSFSRITLFKIIAVTENWNVAYSILHIYLNMIMA